MFTFATCATQGARNYQEDSCLVWQPGQDTAADAASPAALLAVLADGMGGHAGGALASRIVCERFVAGFPASSAEGRTARLLDGLTSANKAVADTVSANPSLAGMGSTLVAAAFSSDGLEWVSVGDSPLYLFRRGEIALLNEDHSLAPALDQLAAQGRISHEEARSDPRRHMLRSAITGEEIELVDVSKKALSLAPEDLVILASDGVHAIDAEEIARIVTAYAGDGPHMVASALIRAVENQRDPYQDNTTIIVVAPGR